LEIIAFPCNNFYNQEPGTNVDVLKFLQGKDIRFLVAGKLECENGKATHPVYEFLKQKKGGGILGKSLKWNYTKFLCNADGVPIIRGGPTSTPLSLENDIVALLQK
jgi:glutathione peroxidase